MRWPDVRVLSLLFVLFHGCTVVVLSIPPPPRGLRGDAPDPYIERTLASWVEVAASVGLPPEQVSALLHRGLPLWNSLLNGMQAPLRPYARLVGANQSWRMFGTVSDQVATIEIDLAPSRDKPFAPLYRVPSSTHRWEATLLRQERMRALLNQFEHRHSRRRWEGLVQVLGDRHGGGDGRVLRFRMRQLTIPPPDVLAEKGQLVQGKAFWELRR